MKNLLKVWLVKNLLTPDPNDFMASISSIGSAGFDDIIDEMVAEGTEHKRETLVDIARRFQRTSSRLVLNGYNVNTGQVYMKSVVTGPFYGNTWDSSKNGVYVSITQGADLRKAVAETAVEILGEKADLMTIYLITNMVSKLSDGSLTIGRNAQIDGSYIKVVGDDPAVGVYFIDTATATETKLAPDEIVTNDPSKLIIYVPNSLTPGNYRLKVVSQYTGSFLLKAPRSFTYEQELSLS